MNNNNKKVGPLKDVVACLTGMSPDQKDRYHLWIETLGGEFTRDFHTTRNTHLIAATDSGEKYEAAMDCSIHVVKPSWLEACHAQRRRVSEHDHSWRETRKVKKKETTKQNRPSLLECLEQVVVENEPNPLFAGCQFLLVGFDHNIQDRVQLSRILRNGMGTIFWEYQDHITHVIVHDNCDDNLRASVRKARLELFGDVVAAVNPWWVVDSWQKKELQSSKSYPPSLERKRQSSSSQSSQPMKKTKKDNASNKNLFRGHIFVLLRISSPHPQTVDYNNKDLEHLVRSNGGQILSLKLLETLKAEHASQLLQQQNQTPVKRNCHVVCFGGGVRQPRQQFSLHPLLAQILRRDLCDLVPVTPNWLQTCVQQQSLVDPTELPLLFQPQPWSWRKLVVVGDGGKQHPGRRPTTTIRISVTGFQGAQRTAIVQAIQDMGAVYDDSMHQKRTTHLICCSRNKGNPKFLKAQEWGITVVFVEWLYHVLQHGLGNEESGDEDRAMRFVVKSKNLS